MDCLLAQFIHDERLAISSSPAPSTLGEPFSSREKLQGEALALPTLNAAAFPLSTGAAFRVGSGAARTDMAKSAGACAAYPHLPFAGVCQPARALGRRERPQYRQADTEAQAPPVRGS